MSHLSAVYCRCSVWTFETAVTLDLSSKAEEWCKCCSERTHDYTFSVSFKCFIYQDDDYDDDDVCVHVWETYARSFKNASKVKDTAIAKCNNEKNIQRSMYTIKYFKIVQVV